MATADNKYVKSGASGCQHLETYRAPILPHARLMFSQERRNASYGAAYLSN